MFSALAVNAWLQELSSTWLLATLIPAVLGGAIAFFKQWIPEEKDICERVRKQRAIVIERCCTLQHRVLAKAIELGLGSLDASKLNELRGVPPREPDVVYDHITALLATFEELRDLDSIQSTICSRHSALMVTVVVALGALLAGSLFEPSRPYLLFLGLIFLVTQVACVVQMRRMNVRLQTHERHL